ncbi:hypothetical protein ABZZ36_13135 [Actinacidiphila glaucinigra]|uniref:hypothetical protein n=1 Tax=Actinacidiphila glaucinigra TaxID=235986 RepID=UPI0033AC6DB4
MFVDASGRRARIIRRAGLAAGVACAGYAVLLAVALAGGTPFAPQTLIPGADVPGGASAQAGAGGRTGRAHERAAGAPGAAHATAPAARPAAAPTVVTAAEVTPSATKGRATASATPAPAPGRTGATPTASTSPRPTPPRTPAASATPSASVPVTPGPDTPAFPPGDAGGDPVPGDGWDD